MKKIIPSLGKIALLSATMLLASASLAYAIEPGMDCPSTAVAGHQFEISVYGSCLDPDVIAFDGQTEYVPYYIEMENAIEYDSEEIEDSEPEDMFNTHEFTIRANHPGKLLLTASYYEQYYDEEDDYWYYSYEGDESDWVVTRIVNVKGTVKFNPGKGHLSSAKKSRHVSANAKVGTLPKPTRSGHRFLGWYTKSSGGNKISSSSKVHFSGPSKTYYAHWR